jgi:hypothetical protein
MSEFPQEVVDKLKGMSGKSHAWLYKINYKTLYLDEEKQRLFRQCLYDWPRTHEPAIATEHTDS